MSFVHYPLCFLSLSFLRLRRRRRRSPSIPTTVRFAGDAGPQHQHGSSSLALCDGILVLAREPQFWEWRSKNSRGKSVLFLSSRARANITQLPVIYFCVCIYIYTYTHNISTSARAVVHREILFATHLAFDRLYNVLRNPFFSLASRTVFTPIRFRFHVQHY